VALVVEPYEETLDRLRDAGFSIDPRREHWGSPRAYVRDPASNLVELMAKAPDERTQ
jgi:catechol 2,3-dioxygenase-like lactoylglutathione lyase family enzyme